MLHKMKIFFLAAGKIIICEERPDSLRMYLSKHIASRIHTLEMMSLLQVSLVRGK